MKPETTDKLDKTGLAYNQTRQGSLAHLTSQTRLTRLELQRSQINLTTLIETGSKYLPIHQTFNFI